MEQFDVPHQKVREKNVYLLHLDATRIILIAAAVIAIIVVSFLLGMNFLKRGDGPSPLSFNHDVFDTNKELDQLKNSIPDPSNDGDLTKPDEKLGGGDINEKTPGNTLDSTDLLTKESARDLTHPGSPAKKGRATRGSSEVRTSQAEPEYGPASSSMKKSMAKSSALKKKHHRSDVMEVSGGKALHHRKTDASQFVIQVASFDKKSKALAEVNSLKSANHDAYLDEAKVGGKRYYRVRIGPISSKKKALDLLNDMQNRERYSESYMVRE
jgi:cell division septation protein DedD